MPATVHGAPLCSSRTDFVAAPPLPAPRRPESPPLCYNHFLIDVDKRSDEINLGVVAAASLVFVVMPAYISCCKNVRLILETMNHLVYPPEKVQLVLNRSNAFTGINVKSA